MLKFLLRICLVALALTYALPKVSGVAFHGDVLGAIVTSVVFNIAFLGLEWLLGIIAFGINIGTLGLGVFLTNGLKLFAGLLTPSIALLGTSKIMHNFLQISNYYPDAIVAGLVLGGLLWATLPDRKKRA